MATTAALPSGPPAANRRIFDILQGASKISQELRGILEPAAEAFRTKSYKTAAKYYTTALESLSAKDQKRQNPILILIKYMLCMCWLESTDAKDLLDSLRNLEELERTHGYQYPMLYYAVGKAYFKLYRFNKADVTLKKGFSVLNGGISVVEYNIPGTNIVIPESSKERLVAALVSLNEQCSSWHRPDAVCCMPDCSSHSQNEGADKYIFFGSPTFNGMVQVSCNNTSNFCTMNFHLACWKTKKEELCSLRKMSDKEVLNWECFTPNCEYQGVRCSIRKIEIYDENAEIKASIEPRAEDVVRHAKPTPQPKGAIRKQQQQQTTKAKVSSAESRSAPYERPARPQFVPNNHTTHNNSWTHRVKGEKEENEEEDDIHDELALKASIEKLAQLRANNFDIKDDAIWRPDLPMYGNEYMLATAELMPDPDFMDEGVEESDLKVFVFSYFHEFIAENGPVKLDVLFEKWNEASASIINANCDLVLKHYLDISEFLLQSVKFAVVGDYICVAEKLTEAYELAKSDTCDILRFFMENDLDQRSNSSSIDDEAIFDALVNLEKNNNSLPYSSVPGDDTLFTKECSVFSDEQTNNDGRYDEKTIIEPTDARDAAPSPPPTPKIPKTRYLPGSDGNDEENPRIASPEVVEAPKIVEQEKTVVPSEITPAKNSQVDTATRKCGKKRPHSAECANVAKTAETEETAKPGAAKESETLMKARNGTDEGREHEEDVFSPAKPSAKDEKRTKSIETKLKKLNLAAGELKESKSTDDLRVSDSPTDSHDTSMSHSGDIAHQGFQSKKRQLSSVLTGSNGVVNSVDTCNSPSNQHRMQEPDLFTELIKEVEKLNAELDECKGKTRHLESELEHVKKAHGAMRIRMLQKSLQSQYTNNHSTIMMKIEECQKNSEICAGIQSSLRNSTGQTLPDFGAEWAKAKAELEQIAKSYQMKFWETNDQLYTAEDPDKLKEVNLLPETLPDMPQTKLIDVIQQALDIQRTHQAKEFQRIILRQPPPSTTNPPASSTSNPPAPATPNPLAPSTSNLTAPLTSNPPPAPLTSNPPPAPLTSNPPSAPLTSNPPPAPTQTPPSTSAPTIRPPPDQPQPQTLPMFAQYPQYPPSVTDFYEGSQLVQANRYYNANQANYPRSLAQQSIFMPPQRNPANPAPVNLQFNRAVPPPVQNLSFFPTVYPGIPYPQGSPASQQMQQLSSALMQQQAFPLVPQRAFGKTQQNISPVQVPVASPAAQNAPSLNFAVPEPAKLAPTLPPSSPLTVPHSLPSVIQQNGQSEQSLANLSRSKSVAELETRAISEQFTAKLAQGSSTSELPTFLPNQDRSSTPLQKKSPFVASLQNVEQSAAKNSQRANSVPEIPKIFMPQETPSVGANKENLGDPTNFVVGKAKDEQRRIPCAVTTKSGATKHQPNSNSNILQASPLFKGVANAENRKNIVSVAKDFPIYETSARGDTLFKSVEKTHAEAVIAGLSSAESREAKLQKKTVHSIDKLMRKMREQYTGVLELDLIKGIECVRKKHGNSLSNLPISRIVREADKFIQDRQRKQLCGYGKRPTSQYFAVSNANPWCPLDEERKRQASFSSTSSTTSLKKEPQHSSSSKKQWEQVSMPNENWNRELAESVCAICLDSTLNTQTYTLQCKHKYHTECIKNWYQRETTCPVCRTHSTMDDDYPPLRS